MIARVTALLLAVLAAGPALAADTFTFAVMGDMPYKLPDEYARFDKVIARVNQARPAFTVHVGDIKSGGLPCTDENLDSVKRQFGTIDGALIYTPGDNEWTDCHRKGGKPLERLAKVRATFFPAGASLGKAPLAVERQAAPFVENARWTRSGVVFATLHAIGSNNNLGIDLGTATEFFERNAANVAWIRDAFTAAKAANAKAVVLFQQANPRFDQEPDFRTGFNGMLDALERETKAFGKPVLLVHGDTHTFRVDKPMRVWGGGMVENLTRLETFGETDFHAVEVLVDPDHPEVFAFRPLMVRE